MSEQIKAERLADELGDPTYYEPRIAKTPLPTGWRTEVRTQPTALRLANALEAWTLGKPTYHRKAAVELRRLHAENERLHQINQSHEMKLSVRGYEIQIEDLRLAHAELHALNGELLEALKYHQEQTRPIERTRAAIAKAEGKV